MIKQFKTVSRAIKCNINYSFRGCLENRLNFGEITGLRNLYIDGFIYKKEPFYYKNENISLVIKPMELMLKLCRNASKQTMSMIERYSFLINIDYHINKLKSYDYAKYKMLSHHYQEIKKINDQGDFSLYEKLIENRLDSIKNDFRNKTSFTGNIYTTNSFILNTELKEKIRTNSISLPFLAFISGKFPKSFREQRGEWFSFIIHKARCLRSEKLKKSRYKIIQAMQNGKRMDREFIWNIISENFMFENTRKQVYRDVFSAPQNQKLEYLIKNSSDEEFSEFVNVLKKEVNNYVMGNLKNDISVLNDARNDIENRMDYSFEKSKTELIKMLSDMSIYHENEVEKIFTDRPMDNFDEISLLQYGEFLNVMDKKINDVVNIRSNRKLMNFYHWLGDYDNNKIKSYATNIKKYNLDKRIMFDRGVINYIYNSAEFSDFMSHEMKKNDLMNRKRSQMMLLRDISYKQRLMPDQLKFSSPIHANKNITLLVMSDFPVYGQKKSEPDYKAGNINIYRSGENISQTGRSDDNRRFYEISRSVDMLSSRLEHHVTRYDSSRNNNESSTTISQLVSKINEQNKSIEKLKRQTVQEAEKAELIKHSVKKISDRAVEEIGRQLYIDNIKKGVF